MTDTLRCRCGGEVRVVRLNDRLLGLGHVRNPRDKHHPVRLARTTAERTSPFAGQAGLEDSRRSSEGPGCGSGRPEPSGPSPDPALTGYQPDGEPRRARRVHAGSLPTPSGARVVVGPPSTPRVPLGAGRP